MIALVFGAGGLTGTAIVKNLTNDSAFEKIIVFSSKDFQFTHPKINFIKFDFDAMDKYKSELKGDVLFCCVGTTRKKAGSASNFERVDLTYPTLLAKTASENHVKKFILISSLGTNSNSSNFYLKTKGRCEENVRQKFSGTVIIFRPGLLLGKRKEKRVAEWIAQQIMKRINFLFSGKLQKYRAVSAVQLARCMISFAKNNQEKLRIVENDEITTLKS